MKITRFNEGRIGVVVDDAHLVDVTSLVGEDAGEWPPVGMNRVIAQIARLRPQIEQALPGLPRLALAGLTLRTPNPWPNKVIAYPVNYHDHAKERASRGLASVQGYFLKSNASLRRFSR